MRHARRGRPRKAGARDARGRLIVAPDRGNAVVQARAAVFARFQDGKADQQIGDQIGRAWAAGLLDGHHCDSAILRDTGRRYAGLYWHEFAIMAPTTAALERQDRCTANDPGADRPGELFRQLDRLARDAGREAAAAMHSLCVDGWWFPDSDQPWLARLIDQAAVGSARAPADEARLEAACTALLAMVEGRRT
ncbi:MAG TPA: hypothetical protein VNT42_03285 [Sphingomonas sp.]|nr:hypothetical protein [Sphingomonas sp.]